MLLSLLLLPLLHILLLRLRLPLLQFQLLHPQLSPLLILLLRLLLLDRQQVLALPIPVHVQQEEEEQQQQQQRQQKRRKGAEGTPTESDAGAEAGGDTAETRGESDEAVAAVAPSVPLSSCISAAAAAAAVNDYLSPATGATAAFQLLQLLLQSTITFLPQLALKGTLKRHSDLPITQNTFSSSSSVSTLVTDGFQRNSSALSRVCGEGLKFAVSGQIPEEVSFEELRAFGLQPEERELPDEPPQRQLQQQQRNGSEAASATAAAAAATENDEVVATLESMGFSNNAAKRAVRATGGAAAESCVEWLMGHLDDPGLNDPISEAAAPAAGTEEAAGGSGAAFAEDEPDGESVETLLLLGFDARTVRAALFATRKQTNSGGVANARGSFDTGRAADWILAQGSGLAAAVEETLAAVDAAKAAAAAAAKEREADAQEKDVQEAAAAGLPPLERCRLGLGDGCGQYRLFAFVTHLGSSVSGGHYICHVRTKDGSGWLQYNDEKVTKLQSCDSRQAYLLLFKRVKTENKEPAADMQKDA
ncbi:LOW QUALITY PROTEIN: uncharacterized protein EMH_0009990 [Eimeria mitis]|uniref:ubiquitinyl hydrolase 1 n=1 Tax=Eimeria mitis TaxID=44415 RepID=U6KHB4_9EIME|nr:LOW QUALITY PROTEIN: uncharacterized protein EMH_0009990 [Eimeria mitis]CDJ36191.1 hypothetical protein EMH_0009990 [Eimeria mitis]